MRLFQINVGATFQELLNATQHSGCLNDSCYFHPYSSAYPLHFQFPHELDFSASFIGVYGLDGTAFALYPFTDLSSNDYATGEYTCGGILRPVTNITGLLNLPSDKCFVLQFFVKDTNNNLYQYATEPFMPVEQSCRESYFNLTASDLSGCGCDDFFYGKLTNVSSGNPDLKHVNTITLWGEYKRVADSRKYEIDASTNKKKSTTTFERWKIGSSKPVPKWVMEQTEILFDAREIVLTAPNLDAQYFDHSDDSPFQGIDVPCTCHYFFDTVLEKLACQGGIFCASDGMIGGCTSPCFENYNPLATYDDGSCYTAPCEAQVEVFLNATLAYWQGVVNNLTPPDGDYVLIPEFIFDSLCNCSMQEFRSFGLGIPNVTPVSFTVVGGVITTFTAFGNVLFTFPVFACTVNIRPVTPANYFGKLYEFPSLTLIYDFETNPNGLLNPFTGATKICL